MKLLNSGFPIIQARSASLPGICEPVPEERLLIGKPVLGLAHCRSVEVAPDESATGRPSMNVRWTETEERKVRELAAKNYTAERISQELSTYGQRVLRALMRWSTAE